MELSLFMNPQDQARLSQEVAAYNRTLNEGKGAAGTVLDKNDFLKILITQLSHQDPTQPMDDKAFIAQMAQFSSLEQMTNMNDGLAKVANLVAKSQAVALLGTAVQVADGDQTVTGIVDEVTNGDLPQLLVNGQYYDLSQVQKVKAADSAQPRRILNLVDPAQPGRDSKE